VKVNRFYSKDKVSFLDILDPFINLKIDEIISSSKNRQTTITSQNKNNGVDEI
jgi:hypothetical protein